ncbi:unnamed protein product [Calypogeia fissa]
MMAPSRIVSTPWTARGSPGAASLASTMKNSSHVVGFLICLLLIVPALCSTSRVTTSAEECLQFLHRHMPKNDRGLIDHDFLTKNVQYALKARELTAWGSSSVPWKLFLNDVLPYAVLNERRDDWRALFYDSLAPLVSETTSIEQAASVINARIWSLWDLKFVGGQTPQTMSPFQVLSAGNASCTGMSILMVDALRSVGVPARVVGAPEWNDGSGGNHDWVEVWYDEEWHFIDAFDGTKFDEGWFVPSPVKYQRPNCGLHSIYASSFQPTEGDVRFPLAWDYEDLSVPGLDVTQWYLDFIERHGDRSLEVQSA